jgi:lipopolysaccharide export system protein LptA
MRSTISRAMTIVLVLAAAIVAAVANPDTVSAGKAPNQPVEINSRKLTAKSTAGGIELAFDGKVKLKQDDVTLSCDKMVVLYEQGKRSGKQRYSIDKQNQSDIAKSIKSAVGSGNVRIVKNELTAVAGKALFDSAKRTVTLAGGSPCVSQGRQSLSAARITIYLDENRAELSGEVKGRLYSASSKHRSGRPIDITSNELAAKRTANGVELTFKGKVRLKQGDMALNCDEMAVLYEDGKELKTGPAGAGKIHHKVMTNSIKSAVATGNVRLTRNDLTVTAGKALFDNVKRTVTLSEGPPRIWEGPHTLSAPTITVNLDQKRAELFGRVKGRLYPDTRKPVTAGAGSDHNALFPGSGSDQPIDITSNKLIADGIAKGAKLVFVGKVRLKQGDVSLSCDKMLVTYEELSKPKTRIRNSGTDTKNSGNSNSKDVSNSIKSVVALGNVQIVKKDLKAKAGKGVFESSRKTVTLTEGPPCVWQGPQMLTAPTIIVHLAESRVELLGGPMGGVTGILNPENQKKEK